MRMHVTQQGFQRLPLHTESEGHTILVSGANENVLVLEKQTPHDVGHIPNGSDEGRREWGIRGGEHTTDWRLPEARVARTVLFPLNYLRVITNPHDIN